MNKLTLYNTTSLQRKYARVHTIRIFHKEDHRLLVENLPREDEEDEDIRNNNNDVAYLCELEAIGDARYELCQ